MKYDYDVEREATWNGYNVICYHCGEEFESKRFDATFCSSRCRTAHHRSLKQADKDIENLHQLIDKLIERCPRRGVSKTAKNLLLARNRIDYLLFNLETDDEELKATGPIDPDKF